MTSPVPPLPVPLGAAARLACALVAPDGASAARWLRTHVLALPLAQWLVAQGIAPYVFHRLRALDLLGYLPIPSHDLLRASYYHSALIEAMQHTEATTVVLSTLAQAGVETVVLKGMALAHTIYPSPRCRTKSDLDLWIQPEARTTAIAALAAVGYRLEAPDASPPTVAARDEGEAKLRRGRTSGGLVELQWPALRGEWARHCAAVDHAAIWARRVPLQLAAQTSHAMAPEDTLIHLCFHQAINHQFTFPCWLRSLLDVHLLVQQPLAWGSVVARARKWQLATVTWRVLDLAHQLLATPVPASALAALAPSPARRRALQRLALERSVLEMWPSDAHPRRFLIPLLLVDRPAHLAPLLGRALFPESDWLRARYAANSRGALWRARLLHPLRLLTPPRA